MLRVRPSSGRQFGRSLAIREHVCEAQGGGRDKMSLAGPKIRQYCALPNEEQSVLSETKINELIGQTLEKRDGAALRGEFESGGNLLVIEDFLPEELLNSTLDEINRVRHRVNRNYVPHQKKGGAVSRHAIDREAEMIADLYRSRPLRAFLEEISGARLLDCLPSDPHTYALYFYTEPGDHISWHYDTSFYRGRRFTLLFGMTQNESCLFECETHRRDDSKATESRAYSLKPGSLVFFDGDGLWHRVTKMAEGDSERIVITMEFVTDQSMHPWRRLVSNVKDAVAYFGLREVFARKATFSGAPRSGT